MSSSGSNASSQGTPSLPLHISAVDISLASESRKTIKSIELYQNDIRLRKAEKLTMRGNESRREKFDQPPALDPSDRIRASVRCSSRWRRRIDVDIDVNLQDNECKRDVGDMRCSYRSKIRNIEVVISAVPQQSSLAGSTIGTIQDCPRFRLLVMGNSGVGKSTLIQKVFGVEGVKPSQNQRGEADIELEFTSPTNERFVVHDSLGFEAGDERHMEIVKDFVAKRNAVPETKNRLHAIWLCLEIPFAGGRLLETGVENLLRRRKEILGDIPLVVVLTKLDLLDGYLEIDSELPKNEILKQYQSRHMNDHCMKPLQDVAGLDVTHIVAVSKEEAYTDSLRELLRVTLNKMTKHHVNEGPSNMAVIAQRISIKEKIDLSIRMGKNKYWKTLMKSAVFPGHTMKECLQVIHADIIAIWNFNDPNQCLIRDEFIGTLYVNILNELSMQSPTISSTDSTGNFFEQLEKFWERGDAVLVVPRGIAKIAFAIPDRMYQVYKGAKDDAKILTAYIVDLICVMQIIFLLISGDQATPETVTALALKAYEESRKAVHQYIANLDGTMGVLPGGRDYILEKIEVLIWRYNIADHQIEELRQKIPRVVPQDSSSTS